MNLLNRKFPIIVDRISGTPCKLAWHQKTPPIIVLVVLNPNQEWLILGISYFLMADSYEPLAWERDLKQIFLQTDYYYN